MSSKLLANMKVLVRADASVDVGSGHLMRCLTLADQLRDEGAEVAFACREIPGAMFDLLHTRGYRFARLPLAETGKDPQQFDAEETIQVARQFFPDGIEWLVVDHYELDAEWERMLRPHVSKLMVIDDLANRSHDCDLLLDQNYEDESRYREFVSKDCRLLLGASYALLRPEYAQYRAMKIQGTQTEFIKRALVFFGGSDSLDLTGATMKALSIEGLDHIELDIVVGANYLYYERLSQLAVLRGRTTIHKPRPHLADLMVAADIAIGGGGATNWERMCLGLPSIVITLAENQTPISEILNRRGVLRLLGKLGDVSIENISDALLSEIKSRQISNQVASAMDLCDGLGVARVINAMTSIQ